MLSGWNNKWRGGGVGWEMTMPSYCLETQLGIVVMSHKEYYDNCVYTQPKRYVHIKAVMTTILSFYKPNYPLH